MIILLLLLSTFLVVHSFLRTARQPYCKLHLKLANDPGPVETETALSPIILQAIYDWISVQNLDDFVSKSEVKNIILEATSNNSLWTSYEEKYTILLDDIEKKLQGNPLAILALPALMDAISFKKVNQKLLDAGWKFDGESKDDKMTVIYSKDKFIIYKYFFIIEMDFN